MSAVCASAENECGPRADAAAWAAVGCIVGGAQDATTVTALGAQSAAPGYQSCAITCPVHSGVFSVAAPGRCAGTPSPNPPALAASTRMVVKAACAAQSSAVSWAHLHTAMATLRAALVAEMTVWQSVRVCSRLEPWWPFTRHRLLRASAAFEDRSARVVCVRICRERVWPQS